MRRTPTGRRHAAHLSDLARDAVELANTIGTNDLSMRAEALAGLIAGRYAYGGDAETYDDLANANLISVIRRRKGLPVALGIIWLHTARAAGWGAHGVDFPAHFLVALEGKSVQAVIDVFGGGVTLDARDLRVLLKRVEGEKAELRPGLLRPDERASRAAAAAEQHHESQIGDGRSAGRAGLHRGYAASRTGPR